MTSAASPSSLVVFSELGCTSCGSALGGIGSVKFPCPDCGQETIGRDRRCRDQSVLYRCPRCGFEGP
ncbi:MAG TPA: zinc finger domain-containing protein [Thermoplasmata archaeon]|nr:zinc finger domain-containing protein [Thermoplasmata archaeon]